MLKYCCTPGGIKIIIALGVVEGGGGGDEGNDLRQGNCELFQDLQQFSMFTQHCWMVLDQNAGTILQEPHRYFSTCPTLVILIMKAIN